MKDFKAAAPQINKSYKKDAGGHAGGIDGAHSPAAGCTRRRLGNGCITQIQTKRQVGAVNDRFEVEADRVADRVVKMTTPRLPATGDANTAIQRTCTSCEEEESLRQHQLTDAPLVQRSSAVPGRVDVPNGFGATLDQLSAGGRPLGTVERTFFEPRFGANFRDVRIHTSSQANRLAQSIQAKAFTSGSHIVFGAGQYNPHTATGKHLIAHELTHTIQQQRHIQPKIQRSALSLQHAFEDELDDVFVNIENVWPAIRNEDQAARDAVRNKQWIEALVRAEASEMELLRTYLLLRYGREENFPWYFQQFLEATDMLGTEEAVIYALLRGLLPGERMLMQATPGVVEVIEDEFSGDEETLALRLLHEGVEHSGIATSSTRSSKHLELHERFSLDRAALKGKSFAVVDRAIEDARDVMSERTLLNDTAFWAMMASEFDPEEVWYLRMIARFRSPSRFPRLPGRRRSYILNIWDAVKKLGTDEDALLAQLRAVSRHPAERLRLVEEPWTFYMLDEELSGDDLQAALNSISLQRPAVHAIRSALEDAIDAHDIEAIRSMLKDPGLKAADRAALRHDPVILEEMGDELRGAILGETVLLLHFGNNIPQHAQQLVQHLTGDEIDVTAVAQFLRGLSSADQNNLSTMPGMHLMITSSGLKATEIGTIMAALFAYLPSRQTAGSEGNFRLVTQGVETRLPVDFTDNEIRISARFNIDLSRIQDTDFELDIGQLEDWQRAIDDGWNGKFTVISRNRSFPLVFLTTMAENLSQPAGTMYLYNRRGRSFHRDTNGRDQELHLYLEGTNGNGLEPVVLAHEFGHVFGNPDEYKLPESEYERLTGEDVEPRRGGRTIAGMMGSQYRSTKIERRHVEAALELINATRDQQEFPEPFRFA